MEISREFQARRSAIKCAIGLQGSHTRLRDDIRIGHANDHTASGAIHGPSVSHSGALFVAAPIGSEDSCHDATDATGSVIAYLSRHHSARKPSLHPIFLPSSYVLPQ